MMRFYRLSLARASPLQTVPRRPTQLALQAGGPAGGVAFIRQTTTMGLEDDLARLFKKHELRTKLNIVITFVTCVLLLGVIVTLSAPLTRLYQAVGALLLLALALSALQYRQKYQKLRLKKSAAADDEASSYTQLYRVSGLISATALFAFILTLVRLLPSSSFAMTVALGSVLFLCELACAACSSACCTRSARRRRPAHSREGITAAREGAAGSHQASTRSSQAVAGRL